MSLKDSGTSYLESGKGLLRLEAMPLGVLANGDSAFSAVTAPDPDTLEAWVTGARRAWITIDLSIANELRHITRPFSKDDPVAFRKHLEKKYQPDTAIRTPDRFSMTP